MKFSRYNRIRFAEALEVASQLRTRYCVARQIPLTNGDGEIRTLDPLLARQVLSQLSYTPIYLGLNGLEPSTSRLSGVRSNLLSYKPIYIRQPPAFPHRLQCSIIGRLSLNRRVRDENGCVP